MRPEDYPTLEFSKKDDGWKFQPLMGQYEVQYDCEHFGDILSAILDYRMMMPESKGMIIDPRSREYFDEGQFEKLEELVNMHNQLAEIRKTFEIRKRNNCIF